LVILALPFRTNCEIVGIISFTLIIVKNYLPYFLGSAKVAIKTNKSNVKRFIFRRIMYLESKYIKYYTLF